MKTWIPDVSEHQGKINWARLAGKIPGAIIRIGYGDDLKEQDDKYAAYNMRECKRLGIPFAVYLYSYANSVKHVESEIAHVKRMCEGYDPVGYWLDLEVRENKGYWTAAASMWHKAFGDKAGVYTWEWGFDYAKEGRRWICVYGENNGKPDSAYKPKLSCDGWQFTSRARIDGINGYVDMSEWYADFAGAAPIEIKPSRKVVTKKEVAALIMRHLCTHNAHGYTQDMDGRQGTGTEEIDIYGVKYTIPSGDRDCSSAVISAYEAAGISCGGATYTGNMSRCMTDTGNFVRRSLKFTAQMGDCYLNDACHTAMCLSAEPDILMEFSINEKGKATGGKVGDQKQSGDYDETLGKGESHLKEFYDYPWTCILQCVNDEIAFVIESDGTITYSEADDGYTGGTAQTPRTSREIALLAAYTILGDYGTGDERKRALGAKYEAVREAVNTAVLRNKEALAKAMADAIEKF